VAAAQAAKAQAARAAASGAPAAPAASEASGNDDDTTGPAAEPRAKSAIPREASPSPRETRTAAEVAVLGDPDDDQPAHEPAPREVVEEALKALAPRVRRCFIKFQIPGKAQVRLVAAPTGGGAESLTVGGDFEGTPTGDCIAGEVGAASLPSFKGAPVKVNHTYVLR
jgi:hypothetical protein